MKITKNNKLVDIKVNHLYNDGSMVIQYVAYNNDGECIGHKFQVYKPNKYAIAYHSEMTDITILFIADNEEVLNDNAQYMNRYFETDGNTQEFNKLLSHFNKQGITIQDDETNELEDDIFIVDYYSYRF